MNILLTGATGFLGSHLLARLVKDDHNVIVFVRKTSSLKRISSFLDQVTIYTINDNSYHDLFESVDIETIIHCATNYGRGKPDPVEILETNLIMPMRLLQLGYQSSVRYFINADTILNKAVNDYTLSKNQFREWLKRYAQKMVCVNIAMEHFYGPLDEPKNFVSSMVKQLLDGVNSIDLTIGEQKRDFIYIDDIISAFFLILAHSVSMEYGYYNFEIGTGNAVTIRELVELIKNISGNTNTQLNFGAIPYREHEVMETNANSTSLYALGWKPVTSLFDGLLKMIEIEQKERMV